MLKLVGMARYNTDLAYIFNHEGKLIKFDEPTNQFNIIYDDKLLPEWLKAYEGEDVNTFTRHMIRSVSGRDKCYSALLFSDYLDINDTNIYCWSSFLGRKRLVELSVNEPYKAIEHETAIKQVLKDLESLSCLTTCGTTKHITDDSLINEYKSIFKTPKAMRV